MEFMFNLRQKQHKHYNILAYFMVLSNNKYFMFFQLCRVLYRDEYHPCDTSE